MLDVIGTKTPIVCGQTKPELDKLQLDKTNKHNNIGNRPDLNSVIPVTTGASASGNGWQSVKFGKPAAGRYMDLQCFDT